MASIIHSGMVLIDLFVGGAKGEGAPNIRFGEVTVVQLHHPPIFIKRYFLATQIYGKYFL